jgi:hypothetical protein
MKVVDLDQATQAFTFERNGKIHVIVCKGCCLNLVRVLKILVYISLGSFR